MRIHWGCAKQKHTESDSWEIYEITYHRLIIAGQSSAAHSTTVTIIPDGPEGIVVGDRRGYPIPSPKAGNTRRRLGMFTPRAMKVPRILLGLV